MALSPDRRQLTAVVLAGDRAPHDSLRDHHGVDCKALIPINGVPMVRRVLGALRAARHIGAVVLSGPARDQLATDQQLSAWVENRDIGWLPAEKTPSTSAYAAMGTIAPDQAALITTADHPLLSDEIVDDFCQRSLASGADVTVGLAPYALVKEAFPEMKKTVLRFRDGEYCGCNLFAFMTADGRKVADFWRRIESQRKKPLVVIGLLGWWSVIRYRLGLLPLDDALGRLSRKLDLNIQAVILPFANAAVDVDSISDFTIVQGRLAAASE